MTKFLKLTRIYYSDGWNNAETFLVNPLHIVKISPNLTSTKNIIQYYGSNIDTVNDHSGHSIKVKETVEEIEGMLNE